MSFSLDIYLEAGLLSPVVVLYIIPGRVSHSFPHGWTDLLRHQQCTSVPFLHIFASTHYVLSFGSSPFRRVGGDRPLRFPIAFS